MIIGWQCKHIKLVPAPRLRHGCGPRVGTGMAEPRGLYQASSGRAKHFRTFSGLFPYAAFPAAGVAEAAVARGAAFFPLGTGSG